MATDQTMKGLRMKSIHKGLVERVLAWSTGMAVPDAHAGPTMLRGEDGSYLGSKDVLALGLAARQQAAGVPTVGGVGDHRCRSAAFLLEIRLARSVPLQLQY